MKSQDTSPHSGRRSEMESRSRNTSRRSSVSQRTEPKKERDQSSSRAIFQRANRFLSRDREQPNDSPQAPVRYYERGHPLPNNCSPERKATIPFRNPELGLPSYRRRHDALSNEAMSGLSPLRCMTYSNFRRGDSQSRASPRSCSPRSSNVSPQRQSHSSSHRRGSTSHLHASSHTSSKRASRKCSPATRRASVVSKTHSPSRNSASNRYTDSSSHSHKQSPSQSSYGQHSLDSEKLYRNLQSIASSAESDTSQQGRNGWSKRSRAEMENESYGYENGRSSRSSGCNSRKSRSNTACNSRDFSPPGSQYNRSQFSPKGSSRMSGYNSRNSGRNTGANSHNSSPPRRDYDQNGHSSTRDRKQNDYRSDKLQPLSKSSMTDRHSRTDLSQSQGSWHETSHSPMSPASPESSHSISPSKQSQEDTMKTDNQTTERSRSTIRRGLEALILSENNRSKSQPPVPEMTIEDYVIIADIPKVNLYPEEEEAIVVRRRPQSRSPRRDKQHSYREEREGRGESVEAEERGRGRERGRDRRERERRRHNKDAGGSSETNSTVSGVTQVSQRSREENNSSDRHEGKQHDSPLMQGWMFMLDNCAEWRKFWFVLDSSGLRYYTNPDAEEGDGPDGEIDISCCLDVVEFEADKNYGLQIHMNDAEITLSAMTSRIRRNWIDVLQRRIRSTESPDNMRSEPTSPSHDDPDMMSLPLTNHREAGVGRDTEQEKRLGDRTKWFQEAASDREADSPWDKVQLKKGAVACVMPHIHETMTGMDIEKKWEDFEKIPVGEMRSLSLIGSDAPQGTNEGLQSEVPPRQQTEVMRKCRAGPGSALPCGPGSLCASRLEELEREHRERLQEMERTHERDRRQLETQREQMLRDEAQHAAKAIEALRKAHQEELERLRGGEQTVVSECKSECVSLQQELDGLSEQYTQRCVELTDLQNVTGQRHTLIKERHREVEQLRKENQELQARLTEEMSLMRSFITGQRSGVVPVGSYERSASELEMLLRVKENEIEYLHKEISCLRNEIQSLIKEKQDMSERYKAMYMELCALKGLSDREISSLKEHLRLTSAALDEEQQQQLRP
ncbi:TRIO and F-actin-binding protein isoform X2 [Hemibagrus wyckioides]|uniref:TRIO and F-actin-binding protein isoform X2 n=1 Tax=Hemibagrus wyckioides TaxID=337641 RepID=UPI00266CE678|nr:TRIO and F-actin-binding protein isoform X2 [Hemibagrus wyckioides]